MIGSLQALQVYKILKAEEERKRNQDPLYVAAKHFRESMIKAQKREQKKFKKQDRKGKEKEMQ